MMHDFQKGKKKVLSVFLEGQKKQNKLCILVSEYLYICVLVFFFFVLN